MKKMILITILFLLIIIPLISASEEVRVFIKYKEQPNSKMRIFSNQQEIISKEKIRHEFENGEFSTTISKEKYEELKLNPNIESIEMVEKKFITLTESIPIIKADVVWNLTENNINITGNSQTICVLDTGIDFTNPSLEGKNATCIIDCTGSSCIENCSIRDWNGHGTHVAGIVAASGTVTGVAKNASLIGLRICDAGGNCFNDDIVRAIDWCRTNKNTYNISVISMSLGDCSTHQTYCNGDQLAPSINQAVASNISVVVSAGNCDQIKCSGLSCTEGIASPGCIESVIPVGGTNDADSIFFQRGNILDLLAPGISIYSTYTSPQYQTLQGTSMSAPHVSGLIALINQYKKLESNKIYTPSEIETILINSGKKINDTGGTNLNFSRINAYQAILYSDEQAPNITSMLPENSSILSQDEIFTCNVTDLQLSNLTIKIYNETSLIFNITTTNYSLQTTQLLTEGQYNWSCEAIDNNSNSIIKTNTLTINNLFIQIQSPTNNTYTNQNKTTINCSAQSTTELSNITFNIYNSTNSLNSTTQSLTELSNYSLFNYTFLNETNYNYNCLSTNNQSQNSQTQNYTITYDKTAPQITLTSPTNNSRTTSPTIFSYDETELNKNSCNLTINNQNYSTFTQTLPDGSYNWSISCTDLANNTNVSQTFKLEIYTEPTSNGGSSSTTTKTQTIEEKKIKEGTQQTIKEKTTIEFKIKSNKHKLTLNKINTDKVEITIESEPITTSLYLNSPLKLNLDNDETFDLELILFSTTNKEANIFIKEINETIPIKHIMIPDINDTKDIPISTNNEPIKENNKLLKRLLEILKAILKFFKIKI